jgi:lysophospholipase L1-like esterase
MVRRWALVLVLLASLTFACKNPGGGGTGGPSQSPSAPVPGFPSSMAALGDSITVAFGSCLAPVPCPRNSWATGDGPQVMSHYRRIVAANPAMRGHAHNYAVPGARVGDLAAQASLAAAQHPQYVTILIGANDACSGGVAAMTSPQAFRSAVDEALARFRSQDPRALLLVVAIPDVYRVWEVAHTNQVALAAWRSGICSNLLANPTSMAQADVDRRNAVRDRITAYNGELESACLAYGANCRYDVATADFAFKITSLSAIDFFHPNAQGQGELAQLTYPGSFSW